jgi:hypothetical protein
MTMAAPHSQYVAVKGPILVLLGRGDMLFLATKLVLLSMLSPLVASACSSSCQPIGRRWPSCAAHPNEGKYVEGRGV